MIFIETEDDLSRESRYLKNLEGNSERSIKMTTLITEKETKRVAKENLQMNIKNGLVVTFLDGEGIVFDPETQKSFRINGTAALFLKMLQASCEGATSSSIRRLLKEQYSIEEDKIIQDFSPFIARLEQYGLVSFQSLTSEKGMGEIKALSGETASFYSKPVIEEEVRILSATGAAVRAARSAAARSAAVSRATAAGFRGFR